MDIKEMSSKMQEIEFVLFTLRFNGKESLHNGELEDAHEKAKDILKEFCLKNGGLED